LRQKPSLTNNFLETTLAHADIFPAKSPGFTVQLSWNIETHETRSVAFMPLTADPKEAVGAEDVLAIAAVAVVEEAEETNRVMSLMALMSRTRIEALQLKSGKP
jgi:hypothetical protein